VTLGCIPAALGESKGDKKAEYEFVIVPKVVHLWFDQANEGAKKAAKMIDDQTGSTVSIDYRVAERRCRYAERNLETRDRHGA
jgi:ribose transport system substrate-binding protein